MAEVGAPVILSLGVAGYCSVIRTRGVARCASVGVACLAIFALLSCRQVKESDAVVLTPREVPGPKATSISAPTAAEMARIREQLAVADRLVASADLQLNATRDDLLALQQLVDREVVPREQTYELQCLGLALGRVMVQNSSLVWVTVEDEYGRDPALNVPGTSVLLFPLTMISKRVEEGREVPVEELYQTTVVEAERRGAEERARSEGGAGAG